jgi:hypothetical protein
MYDFSGIDPNGLFRPVKGAPGEAWKILNQSLRNGHRRLARRCQPG